ncbi:hypothetical protein [Saccharospirillum mangrovi]|uniref:hypothetical protein n=1 Tax=Saccharospirillum mangrovi TaxID=2161747 RepID=UPI001300A7D2|nr:hypothetical protein [Saccharospirillum mangrovi]
MLAQLKVQAAGVGLFLVGFALAGAWFGVALFFGLAEIMHPAWAALLTGATTTALVLLVMACLRWYRYKQQQKRASMTEDIALPGMEALLNGLIDDSSARFIQQHADRATVVALILGGVAGFSRKSRTVMLSVLKAVTAAVQATESRSEDSTR